VCLDGRSELSLWPSPHFRHRIQESVTHALVGCLRGIPQELILKKHELSRIRCLPVGDFFILGVGVLLLYLFVAQISCISWVNLYKHNAMESVARSGWTQ